MKISLTPLWSLLIWLNQIKSTPGSEILSLSLSLTHKHTQSGFLSIFQAWKAEDTWTLSSSSLTHIRHILDVTYGLQPSPLCTGRSLQRCFTPTNLADSSDSGGMRRVNEWLWQMQESKKEHKLAGNLLSIDRKQENKPNVPASDVFPFIVYRHGCYSFSSTLLTFPPPPVPAN